MSASGRHVMTALYRNVAKKLPPTTTRVSVSASVGKTCQVPHQYETVKMMSTTSGRMMRRPLEFDTSEADSDDYTRDVKHPRYADAEPSSMPSFPASEYEGPSEKSINNVTLLGRVGIDPQIRGSEDKPVTTFSLATTSSWRSGGQEGPGSGDLTQKTEWHNIVVFKPGLRESSYNYIKKGTRVHITGRLMYGEYLDKQGIKRRTTSIVCEDIIYLSQKS